MKKICVLGSTGSIGTQTLEVIRRHPDKFSVTALTCGKNTDLFRKQLTEFKPLYAAVSEESDAQQLAEEFPKIEFSFGIEGITDIACIKEHDLVVNGLVGMIGIRPTYEAIRAGNNIAFANKETLVAGGELIMNEVRKNKIDFLPVDSEHSAIFQALCGNRENKIKKILLTASGGPFRNYTLEQIKNVTKEEALNHPNWHMGPKVTIDSSTMMNKGLEVIEARWLFDVDPKNIEVLVHPESALHSAVEFEDGSVIGQIGTADMKIPIAYALSYPKRLDHIGESLDFFKLSAMHFEKPDLKVFKCLAIAFEAIENGGAYPAIMNAANEFAVKAFLEDKISYSRIPEIISSALEHVNSTQITSVDDILDVERKTKEYLNK